MSLGISSSLPVFHFKLLLVFCLFGCGGVRVVDPIAKTPPAGAPLHTVGGFTFEVPATVLAPGDETEPCFIAPLSLTGPSHLIGGAHLTVGGAGMHHGNVIARKKTGEGMRVCPPGEGSAVDQANDVVNGGAVLFGSTTQLAGEEWQHFPDGMAYRIGDDFEIVARMHYLNATTQPLTVAPVYEWFTIDEATLTEELAPFAWDFGDIAIPPLAEFTGRGECAFPDAMHIVSVLPHMHKLGTAFRAGYLGGPKDGAAFLESKGYDADRSVIVQYEPAVDLTSATGAWFACTWKNTFDKKIVYGIGDNEMCTLFGYAYPPTATFSALYKHDACVTFSAR